MDVIKCEKSPEQMVRSRLPALRRTAATAEAKVLRLTGSRELLWWL